MTTTLACYNYAKHRLPGGIVAVAANKISIFRDYCQEDSANEPECGTNAGSSREGKYQGEIAKRAFGPNTDAF